MNRSGRDATPEEQAIYWELQSEASRRLMLAHKVPDEMQSLYFAAYGEADERLVKHALDCCKGGESVQFRVFRPENIDRMINPDIEPWTL